MKKYNKTITVYELPKGFVVDVHRDGDVTNLYLSHKDYGIKDHMFGFFGSSEFFEEQMILNNACDHILRYAEEYCDQALFEELKNEIRDVPDYESYVITEDDFDYDPALD